jgi:hypothetical protein
MRRHQSDAAPKVKRLLHGNPRARPLLEQPAGMLEPKSWSRIHAKNRSPLFRKGTQVRRNATLENPAYLVTQARGGYALKSHSEVEVEG